MYFFRTFKKLTVLYKVHNMGLRYIKTARILGRYHINKEKEAKNQNSLFWGQQDGYPSHPPPPPRRWNCPQNQRSLADSPVLTTWQRSLKTQTATKWRQGAARRRQRSAKSAPRESRYQCTAQKAASAAQCCF
jgi:hypothetical protein